MVQRQYRHRSLAQAPLTRISGSIIFSGDNSHRGGALRERRPFDLSNSNPGAIWHEIAAPDIVSSARSAAVLIVFNGGAKWLDDELRSVHDGYPLIERYPGNLGQEVQEDALPLFPSSSVQVDGFHTDIGFIWNHNRHLYKTNQNGETRVGGWVGQDLSVAGHHFESLIILFFQTSRNETRDFSQLVHTLYNRSPGSCQRLLHNPGFILHDLFIRFSNWQGATENLEDALEKETRKVDSKKSRGRIGSASQNVLDLYRDTKDIHEYKRSVDWGITAFTRFKIIFEEMELKRQRRTSRPRGSTHDPEKNLSWFRNQLISQITKDIDKLQYYKNSFELLWNEYQHMMDLETKLATAKLNQFLGTITFAIFIFAPIGIVMSIFGMNGFTLNPKWAIAVGFIAAFIGLLFIPFLRFIQERWDRSHFAPPPSSTVEVLRRVKQV